VALPPTPASPTGPAQARLILQDPNIASEAKLPALRLSRELIPRPVPVMDRATAQQVWQALQLTPDELITQRLQLLDAYTKQDSATANARAARMEAAKAKTRLNELQETRWQHPAVYSTGAALVGLTGLWLWERKKRMTMQRQAEQWATPSVLRVDHVFALPEVPSAYPAEHVLKSMKESLPAPSKTRMDVSDPIANSIYQEDLLPYVSPSEQSKEAAAFTPPAPWWKLWGRNTSTPSAKSKQATNSVSHWSEPRRPHASAPAAVVHTTSNSTASYTSIHFDDSHADDLGAESPSDGFYTADIAPIPMASHAPLKLATHHEAMEHLLDVRMAAQALVDLGQLQGVQKLLEQHIDALPNTCAWAYMAHLDVCSRSGDRDAFEEMRKRYRVQFNRLAPYWKEADAYVQTLDSYSSPTKELCAAWLQPERARSLISTWLLGAQYSRRQFQLAAYHDLLDLYEMLEWLGETSSAAPGTMESSSHRMQLDYPVSSLVHLDLPSPRVGWSPQL
jgi:hypothetical protein